MIITYKLESEMELVGRHIKVMRAVMENQPVGIIKLSQILGIPEHKVRYSLRILEQEGLIAPSPGGAEITKKVKKEMRNIREVLKRVVENGEELIEELDEIEKIKL